MKIIHQWEPADIKQGKIIAISDEDTGKTRFLQLIGVALEEPARNGPHRITRAAHFLICLLYTSPSPRDS